MEIFKRTDPGGSKSHRRTRCDLDEEEANVDHVGTMGRKLAADWPAVARRPRWGGFAGGDV